MNFYYDALAYLTFIIIVASKLTENNTPYHVITVKT